MARLKLLLHCAALLAATAAGLAVALLVFRASGPAVGFVRNLEIATARTAALIGEPEPDDRGEPVTIARLVASADGTVVLVRPVLREAAATTKAARRPLAEAAETIRAARPVLGAAKQAIDRTEPVLRAAADTVVELRGKIGPVLDNAATLEASANRAVLMWTPQMNGLIAGWKVVGGETAQAARRFDAALPELLAKFDRIAANSDRTTAASAGLFRNLEAATKPLPRWMRIGFGVAPPMAQTAAAAASAWALIGR